MSPLRRARPVVQLSAHRCGAGQDRTLENTRVALDGALRLPVEYVEFDVQRCGDGTLVCFHDDWVWVGDRRRDLAELTFAEFAARAPHFLRYDEVLPALVGHARAHIDLKFSDPAAVVDAVGQAVAVLGADEMIVTTLDDRTVRVVRDWADEHGHDLLVGLSLGRRVRGLPLNRQLRIRASELLPRVRILNSRANLVVANHTLARLGIAAFARRRGLPLLVWTVDTEDSLRYWLRPGRAWLVTSNEPALALRVRAGLERSRRAERRRGLGGSGP